MLLLKFPTIWVKNKANGTRFYFCCGVKKIRAIPEFIVLGRPCYSIYIGETWYIFNKLKGLNININYIFISGGVKVIGEPAHVTVFLEDS